MKKYLIFLVLFLLLIACSKKDDGKSIATVDGEKITVQEFNAELDKIPMNMKMLVATESGKKDFLNRLIVKKLLLKQAKKENVDKDKAFQDRLADIKEQLTIEQLLKKKVSAELNFSDADLEKYYEAHKEEFKRGQEIQTRQIVVKSEPEARELEAKIAKGEDFADLARKFSIDPAAKTTGGDIGYHPRGTLIPEYEAAAFALTKVGQVSQPVKTQLGYHIIKLEGTRTGTYVPFPEVKEFIRQKMTQEKQSEALQKYIESLKKNANIKINDDMLKEETKGEAPAKAPEVSVPEGAGGSVQPGVSPGQGGQVGSAPVKPGSSTPAETEAAPKK
jgi:peptidyl-prolyl cis-trans isomerase C